MRVELKISKDSTLEPPLITIGKELVVYGLFHIDKMSHWLREAKLHLNLDPPQVPEYPEYALWAFDVDLENCTKFHFSKKKNTIDSIMIPIESYYQALGVDTNKPNQEGDVVEYRYVGMTCLRKLLGLDVKSIGKLYGKHHSTVSNGYAYIRNRIEYEELFRRRIAEIATIIGEPNLIEILSREHEQRRTANKII